MPLKWIGIALLAVLTCLGAVAGMPENWIPRIDPFVSVATLTLAVVGFAYTASKARTELREWKARQRQSQRAEVAADTLVAVVDAVAALHQIASAVRTPNPAEATDPAPTLTKKLEWEWDLHAQPLRQLARARVKARIFLGEDVNDLLQELEVLKQQIHAAQIGWAETLASGYSEVELYKQGFGMAPKLRLEDLAQRAGDLLRPHAQLRDSSDD